MGLFYIMGKYMFTIIYGRYLRENYTVRYCLYISNRRIYKSFVLHFELERVTENINGSCIYTYIKNSCLWHI